MPTTNVVWFTDPPPKAANIIHRHLPAPPFRGASRNRFLSCRTMSVLAKQNDEKRHQLREIYGRSLLLKEDKRKPVKQVSFVTKVQIKSKKTALKTEESKFEFEREDEDQNAEEDKIKRSEEEEENENSLETLRLSPPTPSKRFSLRKGNSENKFFFPLNFSESSYNDEEALDLLWAGDNSVAEFDERQDVKELVRVLSRRIQGTREGTRGHKTLTAAFARPTKGELSLNDKGPVPIVPVLTSNTFSKNKIEKELNRYYKEHSKHRVRSWSLPENTPKLAEIPDVNIVGTVPRVSSRPSSLPARIPSTSRYGWVLTNSDQSSTSSQSSRSSGLKCFHPLKDREGRVKTREFLIHQYKLKPKARSGNNIQKTRYQRGISTVDITVPGRSLEIDLERLKTINYESPVPPCSPTGSQEGSQDEHDR